MQLFYIKKTCFSINIYFVRMLSFYVKTLHLYVKRQLFYAVPFFNVDRRCMAQSPMRNY